MEMESSSSRRSFDRPLIREPGLKKPRLNSDDRKPNPPQAQSVVRGFVSNPSSTVTIRDSESYAPAAATVAQQPQQFQELVSQYRTALAELTFNSKPIITNLTIIAGENQHAAKAIAGTICDHILEVTSDQKLPSLYLLDSIVKNIGRDYIKYFAARLPEVFCKAYRQVDSSIHTGMRHLFGTWKCVFPPHPLQYIEKELGFTHVGNGSASSSAPSKSDSQSQKTPHSIHVNPKYLEARQRLQQSSKAKESASDISGSLVNLSESGKRPDRAVGIRTGKPWTDLPIDSIQRSQREARRDPLYEKNVGIAYGDFEYGSELSRKSGSGVGRLNERVIAQGQSKTWYGVAGSVEDTMLGQRNGYDAKNRFANFSSAPPKADMNLKQMHSSSGISGNWKNAEEEEYQWDDISSRLTDRVAVKNLHSPWRSDESENLEIDNYLLKPSSSHDMGSRVDRESSSDSLSTEQREHGAYGHRVSSLWPAEDSPDEVGHSGISTVVSGHFEEYQSGLGGFSTSTNSSLGRKGFRPQLPSGMGILANPVSGTAGTVVKNQIQSEGALSPGIQLNHRPPSPSFQALRPHSSLQKLSEPELSETQYTPRSEFKSSQILGNSNSSPYGQYNRDALPVPLRPATLSEQKTPKLQNSSHLMSSVQQKQQRSCSPKSQSEWKQYEPTIQVRKQILPTSSSLAAVERLEVKQSTHLSKQTPELSSTSSLLAEVMKSGILSKNAATPAGLAKPSLKHKQGQPPLPSGLPLSQMKSAATKDVSAPSLGSPSKDNAPAPSNKFKKKAELRPLLTAPPSSSTSAGASLQTSQEPKDVSNPVSNLLSSLVAKGLISASKSDSPKATPGTSSEIQNRSPTPTTTGGAPSLPLSVSSASPPSSRTEEISCSEPAVHSSVIDQESPTTEIKNLIGFDFKPNVIRKLHQTVIDGLFDDLPHQCSICGLRLKFEERLVRHMEWHASKEQEPDNQCTTSRRWFVKSGDWVAGKVETPSESESISPVEDFVMVNKEVVHPMVPADESQCVCVLCGDLFEDWYCQEKDEWMFKGAVYMTMSSRDGELVNTKENVPQGPIVHVACMSDDAFHELGLAKGIKVEEEY